MSYFIERRLLEPAPHLAPDDVMSVAEAARALNVPFSAMESYFASGRLTTIVDLARRTAHRKPRRLALRAEVEALAVERGDHGKGGVE